jgi:ABC-2 type transport system permease protein
MNVQVPPRAAQPGRRSDAAAAVVRPRLRTLTALPARLARRGAVLLCLAGALYAAVEVVSYRATYPDPSSREQLAQFSDNAAVRLLQGVPHGVETVGGFVVWDAGWFLSLIVAIWALLVTTRLTRAEEDTGRADLLLVRSVLPARLLLAQLLVVTVVLAAFAATVAVTLVALGLETAGAVLWGAGLAGVGLTSAAIAALAAQLFGQRRRAVGAAAMVVGLSFAVRMLGNSEPERGWLLHLTPFGWLDRLQPFTLDRWLGLLPFLLVPLALTATAVQARTRRDTGEGVLAASDRRPPRLRLLGGAAAFTWRLGSGVLAAWLAGVAGFGLVIGAMVSSFVDIVEEDAEYRRVLEQLGVDLTSPVEGFLSLMSVTLALVFATYVSWRVGALRAEEASGRLEHVLVRPVGRVRWLGAACSLTVVAAALLVVAAATGIWAGAALTGADVGAVAAYSSLLRTLPVVGVFVGLAVLAFGAAPRLTVAFPVSVAVVTYLFDLLATVVDLPQAVLDLSPFRWLPRPPETYSAGAVLVLVLVGLAAAGTGTLLFARRDITGD